MGAFLLGPFFLTYLAMSDWIILAIMVFILLWLLYGYFEPKIEIVLLYKKRRVFLWYNEWEGQSRKRVYKPLFDI